MAESLDPKRTVVVFNVPPSVDEDQLTIHFQSERNGGGDVDDVVLEQNRDETFVVFDSEKVAASVLDHEQIIDGTRLQIQSYEKWLRTKKKKPSTPSEKKSDSYTRDEIHTIYVSGLKDTTTEDSITLFFESKRRSGGGELRPGKEGYKRMTPNVARLTFVSSKDAEDVLRKVNETKLKLEESLLRASTEMEPTHDRSAKKESTAVETKSDSDTRDEIHTIYVSGLKDTTTEDSITLFFESKRRSGGGDLRPGKERYKRMTPNVARLTFVSSKDAEDVLRKVNETKLKLEENLLRASTEMEPTHDRSILLVKNIEPGAKDETLKNLVEATTNADVLSVVLGKDGKAIMVLKNEIDEEHEEEIHRKDLKLDGSFITLEFAPLSKAIRVSKIPPGTSSDDIRYKFSNKKLGGSKVTDMMLDKNNGVANVYFEEHSVVSTLVKKMHTFKDTHLTVIPFYDDFEALEEVVSKTTEFSSEHQLDSMVMDFIMNHQVNENIISDLKSMKYDKEKSSFRFSKEFEDPGPGGTAKFDAKMKEFLQSFVKDEVKIPKGIFEKVKESFEEESAKFGGETVDVSFNGSRVIFVGKKESVIRQKRTVETLIDKLSEEVKKETHNLQIEDTNKLKFLKFIDYFKKLETEYPEVKIHGHENPSGNLTIFGTSEKVKDVELKILKDVQKIFEIVVEMSVRQIHFLQRTQCQIVNDQFRNDDVMLMLISVPGHVGAKGLQAKILSLQKCDNSERKRLVNIVQTKTSEKCVKMDEDTAKFLAKSNELQEFKKEQFEKHQVMIDTELAEPCNLWIVCERTRMNSAEQAVSSLMDDKKITSCSFIPADPMKVRFLTEHSWGLIKERETGLREKGVQIEKGTDSFQIKGTKSGRKEMITFLENLAEKVVFKAFSVTEPGMKKQMTMDTTNAIIAEVEKSHKCIIERESQPGEAEETGASAKDAGETMPTVPDGDIASETLPPPAPPYQSMSVINDKEVRMAAGQKIRIVIGDLAREKVDVIVNTTNDKVDLNANPCGKALLKVAGKQLLEECQKIGSLKPGQMAATGPAKLNCQKVYHVRSAHWDSGKGAPTLRQLIKSCLEQVTKDKFTSIAIPAIGTGHLRFPRPDVAKMFFEEVTKFLAGHPQSGIDDVRFVAYGGDKESVEAFLAAVQEIKAAIASPASLITTMPARVDTQSKPAGRLDNVNISEKPDGTLEISLRKLLSVQVLCNDITNENTDLIMHVTNQEFSFQGGVGKALLRAGGDDINTECKAIGQPALFSTQYTKAGKLATKEIAHVIGTSKPTYPELKRCLGGFFDDVSKKNIASVSFSAIGAGAMGFSESESADLIFDNLSKIADSKNPSLKLVRIVIFEKPKFVKFKDAAKAYFTPGHKAVPVPKPRISFNVFGPRKSAKSTAGKEDVKIYADERVKTDKAWAELRRKLQEFINDAAIDDDVIKKFSDEHLKKLRQLESDYEVKITADKKKGRAKIKGHVTVLATVQEAIRKMLKEITEKEGAVPEYWDSSAFDGKCRSVVLSPDSKKYKDVDSAFHKTAPNVIVSIERIENREIYELYNVKRKGMMKKYGSNFAGKELMLFHGTSRENIEPINGGGLNRSYAGMHATVYGRGVYFARDAQYSCNPTYSPVDPTTNLRYMYYAKVLVGEYTIGNRSMIVAPNKPNSPNETYDSVVDNQQNPGIYVLFQDYEFYTEYLITFK